MPAPGAGMPPPLILEMRLALNSFQKQVLGWRGRWAGCASWSRHTWRQLARHLHRPPATPEASWRTWLGLNTLVTVHVNLQCSAHPLTHPLTPAGPLQAPATDSALLHLPGY